MIEQHSFGVGPQFHVRHCLGKEQLPPGSVEDRGPTGGGVDLHPLRLGDAFRQIPLHRRSEAGPLHGILNHLEEPGIEDKTQGHRDQQRGDEAHQHLAQVIEMLKERLLLVLHQHIPFPRQLIAEFHHGSKPHIN